MIDLGGITKVVRRSLCPLPVFQQMVRQKVGSEIFSLILFVLL